MAKMTDAERQRNKELCLRAYAEHKGLYHYWPHGEPFRSWAEKGCDVCVRYADGNTYRYKWTDNGLEWW